MAFALQIRNNASQDRLEKLIEARLQPGADKEAIDRRIWDLFGEEWAIMYTDLAGFSRQVAEFGIIHFLQTIYESQKLFVPCIDRYDGILLKVEADSMGRTFQFGEGWHSSENAVRFWTPSPRVPKEADTRCYAFTTAYATMIHLCNAFWAQSKTPTPSPP